MFLSAGFTCLSYRFVFSKVERNTFINSDEDNSASIGIVWNGMATREKIRSNTNITRQVLAWNPQAGETPGERRKPGDENITQTGLGGMQLEKIVQRRFACPMF